MVAWPALAVDAPLEFTTYERQTGGRVFATALAVLMLEEPYRHSRLTQ